MPRPGWIGGFALWALLLAAESAAEPRLEMSWDAPKACPDRRFVEEEVSRIVGRSWQDLGAEWREVRASVKAEAGGYRLRLHVITRSGLENERSVLGASCTEAAEAAVAILTAGVALTPPTQTKTPPTDAAPSQAPEKDVLPRVETAPESVAPSGPLPFVGVRLGIDAGSLVRMAPWAQLAVGLELGRVSLAGFVGATGNVSQQLDGSAAGAEMFLVAAGPEACVRFGSGAPSVSVCGGAEVGSLEARGFGAAERRADRTLWSAGLLRGALDWQIGQTAFLSAGASALVPVRRLRVLSRPEEVHQTSALVVRPSLGIGVRFP